MVTQTDMTPQADLLPVLLTTREAAKILRIDYATLHRMRRRGQIEGVYVAPRTIRFRTSTIARIVREGYGDYIDPNAKPQTAEAAVAPA